MKKLSLQTIQNDKRTRNAVIGASVGVVLVLAAAVTIPVMLHNRAPVAQAAEPSVTVTEPTTAETTVAVPTSEAVTVPTVSETTEPTTAQTTNSTSEKKEKPKSSAKPAAQGAGNGSGAAAKQPAPNTPPAEPQKPNKKQWTQAEVNALVAEMKAYANSRGLGIANNLGIQGTSWRSPSVTESAEDKIRSQLKYHIDEVYDLIIEDFGYIPDGPALNIVTQQYTDSDGYTQWEIYVVY